MEAKRPESVVKVLAAAESMPGGVLEQILAGDRPVAAPPEAAAIPGVVIGKLVGFERGSPLVNVPAAGRQEPARSVLALGPAEIGRDVVLMLEGGDLRKPIVLGVLQRLPQSRREAESLPAMSVEIDGERLTVTAEKELVLRCGEASITLTRAGKVLIRGAYLLSRSSGVNRIKGGSVQIN